MSGIVVPSLACRLKRLHIAVLRGTTKALQDEYKERMGGIARPDQSAMSTSQTKTHKFYRPAIAIAQLLDRLAPTWRDVIGRGQLLFSLADAVGAVTAWAKGDFSGEDEGAKAAHYVDVLVSLGIPIRPDTRYCSRAGLLGALGAIGGASGSSPPSAGKGDKTTRTAVDLIERLLSL